MAKATRTKAQVLAERATVMGCCDRFADRMSCDCLENAVEEKPVAVNDADWLEYIVKQRAERVNAWIGDKEFARLLALAEECVQHRLGREIDRKIMGDWLEDASGKAEAAKDVARKCILLIKEDAANFPATIALLPEDVQKSIMQVVAERFVNRIAQEFKLRG